MNWKKWLKYFLVIWLIATIGFVIWANYGLNKMYGAHTDVVDHQQFNSKTIPVAINNVNLLSPEGDRFIPNQTVLLDKGLIMAIDSVPQKSEQMKIINGEGKFLIPGLIDAHVHLFKSQNDLLLYVANGVTQIRELIGSEEILTWKKEVQEGRLGPEMYVASPRLGSFGTMEGWFMSWAQGYDNITTAKDGEKAVEAYHKQGYDGVKIYSQLNKETYEAICQAAEKLGMGVMGHIPFSTELSEIYLSSQSDIAHFEEIMNALNREFGYYNGGNVEEFLAFVDKRCEEVANNLIKHNITITSTLWGTKHLVEQKYDLENLLKEVKLEYVNTGLCEWSELAPGGPGWLPEVNMYTVPKGLTPEESAGRKYHWETYIRAEQLVARKLISRGVKIMAGTDANIPVRVPGFSFHDELESLKEVGMSTEKILQSATKIPADWMKSNAGEIVPQRKANLVLLDKNPLTDIRNTTTINTVFLNGRVLDRGTLDQMLNAVRVANDSCRKKDISRFVTK